MYNVSNGYIMWLSEQHQQFKIAAKYSKMSRQRAVENLYTNKKCNYRIKGPGQKNKETA